MNQAMNTVQFRIGGAVIRRGRILRGETGCDAARRIGITVGDRLCQDGSVRMAEYNGQRGVMQYREGGR